jgi:hypothetical protein
MSVDFRQRKPSEYLKILRRRKWLIILPSSPSPPRLLRVYKLPTSISRRRSSSSSPRRCPRRWFPGDEDNTHAPVDRHQSGRHQPQFARAAGGKVRVVQSRATSWRADGSRHRHDAQRHQGRRQHQPQRHHQRFQHQLPVSRSKIAGDHGRAGQQVHQRADGRRPQLKLRAPVHQQPGEPGAKRSTGSISNGSTS